MSAVARWRVRWDRCVWTVCMSRAPAAPERVCARRPLFFRTVFLFIRFTSHARGHAPLLRHSLNSTHCLRFSAETACSSGLHEAHFTEVHTLLSAEIHTAHTSHAPTQHTPSLSQLHGPGFVDALSLPPPFTNRIGFSQVVLYAVPHPSHSKKKEAALLVCFWSAPGLLTLSRSRRPTLRSKGGARPASPPPSGACDSW